MTDIEFIERKLLKCKSARNRARLQSVLGKLNALDALKSHLSMVRTLPKIADDGKSIEMSYTVMARTYSEIEEMAMKSAIERWIVQNIDKKHLDALYASLGDIRENAKEQGK